MGDYNRTIWKDHVKDQNGNVIQQGTPVSAQNLNNIENQIVALSAKENILAELVRESIPSGFTTLSDLDFTTMSTTPNTIKLLKDSVAYANGYKVTIPAGTTITLDAPPTSGTRDDLVFLECWKQVDANGAEQLNWRIRIVDGVDFATYLEGVSGAYIRGQNTSETTTKFILSSTDAGLYKGTVTGASSDNVVYAIPMFKVHRRNSGGYSVNNANGGDLYIGYYVSVPTTVPTLQSTTVTVSSTAGLSVGDYLDKIVNSSNILRRVLKVISINSSTSITILNVSPSSLYVDGNQYMIKSSRYDNVYSNIVAERDILDLRHQVSLTGFNYQALLEENFDKLLRGELQTNAKTTMLKTYHGLAKTPIDANHVFYASFDGTTVAEVGGSSVGSAPTTPLVTRPSVTGLGMGEISYSDDAHLEYAIPSSSSYTIDFWLKTIMDVDGNFNLGTFSILDSLNNTVVQFYKQWGNSFCINNISWQVYAGKAKTNVPFHVRVTVTATNIKVYINGGLFSNITSTFNVNSVTKVRLPMQGVIVSDFSISNIDRGAVFATLPQDFIDGYARISPSFNEQRNIFSDALTSEYKCEIVKASGETKRQYTLTQATTGAWTAGDTLKVRGLGGEIITGVIDSDTALATITQLCTITSGIGIAYVNDVSKLTVGDSVVKVNSDFTIPTYCKFSITAIDPTNKTVTIQSADGLLAGSLAIGDLLVESTASSSSPTVKATASGTAQAGGSSTITLPSTWSPTDGAYNGLTITITGGTGAGQVRVISGYVGSTKVATVGVAWTTTPDATSTFSISNVPVAGTWSGLGTNQATFTLGTLYALSSQNIQVEYSLNEIAGQGGVPEVFTTTLAGEIGGKKLALNPTVHIRGDFAGKVPGSVVENPNILKYFQGDSSSILKIPSAFALEVINDYSSISMLDGVCARVPGTLTLGAIPQQLCAFNVIEEFERKFGSIPALDIAGKVAYLKVNLSKIVFNWWGYGSCPGGNKAKIGYYYGSSWISSNYITTASPSLQSVTYNNQTDFNAAIQSDGFVYFLAYTDASDGITAPNIYTDYCNIELALKTPTGYDVLAPENPRRDDGKSNMLLVRKENKEIQSMFGSKNTDGIVTYGDYVPLQNRPVGDNLKVQALANKVNLITNGSGKLYVSDNISSYRNALNRLITPSPSYLYNGWSDNRDILFDWFSMPTWYTLKGANTEIMDINSINSSYYHQGLQVKAIIPSGTTITGKPCYVYYVLVKNLAKNELGIFALCSDSGSFSNVNSGGSAVLNYISLPNRPLIK